MMSPEEILKAIYKFACDRKNWAYATYLNYNKCSYCNIIFNLWRDIEEKADWFMGLACDMREFDAQACLTDFQNWLWQELKIKKKELEGHDALSSKTQLDPYYQMIGFIETL